MLRSARSYDPDSYSQMAGMRDDREKFPDKTVQSEKENCDINVIMRRFRVTGQMPPGSVRLPEYADYSEVTDFHTAMNVVRAAREDFMALPADVRKRFGNDPQNFLEFCGDPNNVDEMIKMGLANVRGNGTIDPRDVSRETKDKGDARNSVGGVGESAKTAEGSAGNSAAK